MIEIAPPAELNEFVQALGPDDTLRLIEAYAGTQLAVPRMFDPERRNVAELVDEFDAAMVKALIQRWGGSPLKVPAVKWWRARLYAERGLTYAKIARKLGCDIKTVWTYLHPQVRKEQFGLTL